MRWPWSKTYEVKCPDGSTRTIYKRLDDAFPLFIPGWKGDIDAEIKAFEQVPAKARAAYETKIQGLLYSLDERNQSLMMTFRTVYVAYSSDPCGQRAFFQRQIEKLVEEQHRLSLLRIQVHALIELVKGTPKVNNQVLGLFADIVHQLGGRSVPEAAALEIQESRRIVRGWIEESK